MFGLFKKKSQNKKQDILSGSISVVSAINDGVIVIDCDKKIHFANPAIEKIIGWDPLDARDLQYYSVVKLCDNHGEELPESSNPIEKALAQLDQFSGFSARDLFLKTISGKIIPVDLAINLLDKNTRGVVVVFRNIAKELKENREQAEFISTASHEMRTPVASIEGYLGLALNPATATIDDRARDYLQKAHENTQHLGQLFRDLLEVSRADDGRLKNNPKVIDAVEFTRKIWQGLEHKAREKGLEYRFLLDRPKSNEKQLSPVYYVNVDQDHLQETINNLIENALKYTLSGSVEVDVFNENSLVKITIADTGIGIPAEDIPHLFQKFYRVDNSDTREIGGTGLGLYLCRRLVEAMGGSLSVESEYQKGSIFTISLPRLSSDELEQLKRRQKSELKTDQSELPTLSPASPPIQQVTPSPPDFSSIGRVTQVENPAGQPQNLTQPARPPRTFQYYERPKPKLSSQRDK